MPPPHTATAASTYTDRAARIRVHLTRIETALGAHEQRQRDYPTDWGFAGDLGWYEERLAEVFEEEQS